MTTLLLFIICHSNLKKSNLKETQQNTTVWRSTENLFGCNPNCPLWTLYVARPIKKTNKQVNKQNKKTFQNTILKSN